MLLEDEIIGKAKNDIEYEIPTKENYKSFLFHKMNLKEIKYIAKNLKLKLSFKKEDLIQNIISYFEKTKSVIKIQSLIRRKIVQKWVELHGPGFYKRNRHLCVNDTDFLTLDKMIDIPTNQFFSFPETSDFIYGYDLLSIKNLFDLGNYENPYTRKHFSKRVVSNVYRLIKLSKIIKQKVDIVLKMEELSGQKSFEMKSLELFQNINNLGHYSNHLWFTSLSKAQLIIFIKNLYDVWTYRCNLTSQIRYNICPLGNPFRFLSFYNLIHTDVQYIQNKILKIINELTNTGINTDSKNLGAYYVLGCLTIVSSPAAISMPLLYDAFL